MALTHLAFNELRQDFRRTLPKLYHPGRNYYKISPWNIILVIIFVIIIKTIPQEHFLCNVAAAGLSLFATEHAKEFAL